MVKNGRIYEKCKGLCRDAIHHHNTTIRKPRIYNWGDWARFCDEVTHYHKLTRPNDTLVIHKIETFRKFMSAEATQYLSGFLRWHPRFETEDGWDRWLWATAQMMRIRRIYCYKGTTPSARNNLERVIMKYKNGRYNMRRYWQALDALVEKNLLSNDSQRVWFWEHLKEEDRAWAIRQSAYFDPNNPIWQNDSQDKKWAEQILSLKLELWVVEDVLNKNRWVLDGVQVGLDALAAAILGVLGKDPFTLSFAMLFGTRAALRLIVTIITQIIMTRKLKELRQELFKLDAE